MAGIQEYFNSITRALCFVRKRKGFKVPFDHHRIIQDILKSNDTTQEMAEEDAIGVTRLVLEKIYQKYHDPALDIFPPVDSILDTIIHCLYETGFARTADNFKIYRAAKQHVREGIISPDMLNISGNPPIFQKEIGWQKKNGLYRFADLNALIQDGRLKDLVHLSHEHYEEAVNRIAEEIVHTITGGPNILGFSVTGPSSSGKTTTTEKITEKISQAGRNVKTISIDNYFKGLQEHQKDLYGDFDFEEPHAIDTEYFFSDLEKILNHHEVLMPYYDFKEGKSYNRGLEHPKREKIKLEKDDVLALDFLHLLYIMAKNKELRSHFHIIYTEPMFRYELSDGSRTRYTEVNLLRRSIRDSQHRNLDFNGTIEHWHHVRDGQLTYMCPLIQLSNVQLNGGLVYDFFVLKSYVNSLGGFPNVSHLKYDQKKRLTLNLVRNINKTFAEIENIPYQEIIKHLSPKDLIAEFIPIPGEGYRKQ